MRTSVFGMGYVGCVTAACLAESGHEVCGVDISADKVEAINGGRSPIVEARVEAMIGQAASRGALRATTDPLEAVLSSDLSLVCVGTPSLSNGSADIGALTAVSKQIGAALSAKGRNHCVVYRSTTVPGSIRQTFIPILEAASGKQAHRDFHVCMHPEFLREGTAVADFFDPPFHVIGEATADGGDLVARLYEGHFAPVERTSYEAAEILKYACNAFHALKIAFANEIGTLCKTLGVDSHRVMEIFARDRKLNISPAYLRPGFAFGGSCLPKDLRALQHLARQRDLDLPVLGAVLASNRLHLERAVERILATGEKRIGVLGLSFKPGTDDLRESPSVALIETLIGKGCQVRIYDPDVLLSRVFGANRRFIEQEIPHIGSLMATDLEEVIRQSEVVVVSKPAPEFNTALTSWLGKKLIFDLARIPLQGDAEPVGYDGICW
jgi:GDP-mannose 6-dehydrogenase